jgi:hypothetical protein
VLGSWGQKKTIFRSKWNSDKSSLTTIEPLKTWEGVDAQATKFFSAAIKTVFEKDP